MIKKLTMLKKKKRMELRYELLRDGKGLSFRVHLQEYNDETNAAHQQEFLDTFRRLNRLNEEALLKMYTKACKYMRFCKTIKCSTDERSLKKQKSTCAVCLESVESPSNDTVVTACDHMFHKSCILKAAGVDVTCPMCRTPLGEKSVA